MISIELMSYCLISGAVYLLVLSGILQFVENRLGFIQQVPENIREKYTYGWFLTGFVMEFLFFVVIPTMAYGFFYIILPLEGLRAGVSVALVAFTLGAVPFLMGLSIRINLPLVYLLFLLLAYLIKLAGCLIIIAYLYAL